MDELLKLIKAAMKEGTDIAAIETLVKGLDVLAGVKTVEDAKALIAKTDLLKSANDSLVSIAVASHDKKFTDEKLPGILKEKEAAIRAEINPKETDEQKKFRLMEDEINTLKGNESRSNLKAALLTQATELGYKGNVDLFLSHGEKAGEFLKSEAKRFKTAVDEQVSSDIKKLYGDTKPKTSTVSTAKTMTRATYEGMNPNEQANVNMKEITLVD